MKSAARLRIAASAISLSARARSAAARSAWIASTGEAGHETRAGQKHKKRMSEWQSSRQEQGGHHAQRSPLSSLSIAADAGYVPYFPKRRSTGVRRV